MKGELITHPYFILGDLKNVTVRALFKLIHSSFPNQCLLGWLRPKQLKPGILPNLLPILFQTRSMRWRSGKLAGKRTVN